MKKTNEPIFTPYTIGPYVLKNRLVALPVFTGYAFADGKVSPMMLEHYARLGASGVAMVIVANAAVSADGRTSPFSLRIDHDNYLDGLSALAEAIQREGSLACLQLNHAGQLASADQPRQPAPVQMKHLRFKISALKEFMEFFPLEKRYGLTHRFLKQANKWQKGMNAEEQTQVIASFCQAARRAYHAGFDMIELHGANGYLICQFLSAFSNSEYPRVQEDFEQRTHFPLALIKSIKQHLPKDFPIGFRLILEEWVPNGIDVQQAIGFAKMLEKVGIAYLSNSAGTFNSIFLKNIRKRMARPAYLQQEVAMLHRHVKTPVIISGRILTPAIANQLIENRATDLIGLGRSLRTDPDWVSKAQQPNQQIRSCVNCLWCLKQVILDQGFNCQRWPERMRLKTMLRHQLQQRNNRILCVVAEPEDFTPLKIFLEQMKPAPKCFSPSLLCLPDKPRAQVFEAEKQAFIDWLERQDPSLGPIYCHPHRKAISPELQVQDATAKYNYGVVLLPQNRLQAWRTRLCFQIRKRAVVLMGRSLPCKRLLVAVDLSEATLLILSFLKAFQLHEPEVRVKIVHMQRHSDEPVQAKWQRMTEACQMDPDMLPLDIVETEMDPATGIVELVRHQAFDTIIMGRRGLSGLKRLLLGSVSAKTLKYLPNHTLIFID
jgi:2,4-dienoyl-CoA reductase (NADPH2)